ncbi:SKI family transcriptional corepressor 2 [Chelonus insularis]|uniref:SKI family transcriptional corepressor 2 n=1 Tax=Chelonus insularis TaxID=460826 RepID=UPI00158BFB4B|nr:SKI family transcriptional corepressor 2 [Chelonus insularis]
MMNYELQVGTVSLYGIQIVSLVIEGQERLCLAQISNTLLKQFSYNEIHNRRVALGITCVQCTPVQLEILRRAGAMPPSSRRCGMITRREAERLCKSFLSDNTPPRLPEDFAFSVYHECAYGCRGAFLPSRYNSSRAKCIKCSCCGLFFSPNKFIFHSHQSSSNNKFVQPDAANFNSWRRHMKLLGNPPDNIVHAWEDVKAMFNGGTRKRLLSHSGPRNSMETIKQMNSVSPSAVTLDSNTQPITASTTPVNLTRVSSFSDIPLSLPRNFVMDYMWHQHHQATAVVAASKNSGFTFAPYTLPWFAKQGTALFPGHLKAPLNDNSPTDVFLPPVTSSPLHSSAFRPVIKPSPIIYSIPQRDIVETVSHKAEDTDDDIDIETTEDSVSSIAHFEDIKNPPHISNDETVYNPQISLCWSPAQEMILLSEKLISQQYSV